MATFIDNREEEVELQDNEQIEELDEAQDTVPAEPEEVIESDDPSSYPTDELPEKYKGKSVTDIIAMHQNAEQLLGKQGQEVGELRKIVDDFISSQSVKQAHTTLDEFDEAEFFEKPKESLEKLLNNHPSIQQTKILGEQLRKQETLALLKTNHPDFTTIIQDPKFAEWVNASKVRQRLLREADTAYDYDSADELLSLWKERQQVVQSTVNTEKVERKKQVKAASSGTSKGSGESVSRKIYRRGDIIDLMRKDPDRYASLMPEIRQAYAEGRVK